MTEEKKRHKYIRNETGVGLRTNWGFRTETRERLLPLDWKTGWMEICSKINFHSTCFPIERQKLFMCLSFETSVCPQSYPFFISNIFVPSFSEKEMAPHSSVLAWRIPWTGHPGGLPSMGSHRVRHAWSELAAAK